MTAGACAGPEPGDVGEPMLSPGHMWLVQFAAGLDSEESRMVVERQGRPATDDR